MSIRRGLLAGLLSLIAATGPSNAEAPSPAGIKSFGGWTGTCNNIGACVAVATTDANGFFYLRIARAGGVTASPQVKIVYVSEEPLKGATPLVLLKADDLTLGPYAATGAADGSNQLQVELAAGQDSASFVEAVRNADHLAFTVLDASGTLDLKNLAATLRWIDGQQGRMGTPTALVAKGMTPVGQVPEPQPMPVVTAAGRGTVQQIEKPSFPAAIRSAADGIGECDRETTKANETGAAWRVGPNEILWAVSCLAGAYNFSDALFLSDATGGDIRPVKLPLPQGVDANNAANIVTNTGFDVTTLVLSEFGKDRGIADCGDTRDWVWTGASFALLSASQLDACPGTLSEDWPNIYTAKRVDP